jgi:plasmid stabilization system protein ParE
MRVRYKARALRHIEAIHSYIAKGDPGAAARVVRRIEHSIGRLATLPLSGRPGVVAGTRILVVPGLPYVVIYRARNDEVDIIAVLHTARGRRS